MASVSDDETEKAEPAGDAPRDEPTRDEGDGAGETADAIFEALWGRAVEAWDDDKPHAAVLQHALEAQRLPDLAGRYRKIKETDEARAARAQKKIDGIVVAATQLLMATKTPPRTKVPWTWTASVAGVCLFVVAWLLYRLFGHR